MKTQKKSKWSVHAIIGKNNEQPGIQWARNGIAALGEPSRVLRIEYYGTETERDEMIFKSPSPNFAK